MAFRTPSKYAFYNLSTPYRLPFLRNTRSNAKDAVASSAPSPPPTITGIIIEYMYAHTRTSTRYLSLRWRGKVRSVKRATILLPASD